MRLLKQIWMIFTLDCTGSAHLTSESLDRPLNWAESLAVRLHRLICAKSRRLNRQMIELNEALRKSESFQALGKAPGLSSDARSRIQQAIRETESE